MRNSTIDIVTSCVTLYTRIDKHLIEQILKAFPDDMDVARATTALRSAKNALGYAITSPIAYLLSTNGSALQECENLKLHLDELIDLSSIPRVSREDGAVRQIAFDLYLAATRVSSLLNK